MSGIITNMGRIFVAQLLLGEPLEGITHCALGDGDPTLFTDPLAPPAPQIEQTSLHHEFIRKKFYKRVFLREDAQGPIIANGVKYMETGTPTNTIGVFFRFEEGEANGATIREYGFFGGMVAYVSGLNSAIAQNGIFDAVTNPAGEVVNPGYLYEVINIPDFNKIPNTRLELVAIKKV